jgi:hypothetical protein
MTGMQFWSTRPPSSMNVCLFLWKISLYSFNLPRSESVMFLHCAVWSLETKWVCFIVTVSYTIQVLMLCIQPVLSHVLRIRACTCGMALLDFQRNRQMCTQMTVKGIVGIGAAARRVFSFFFCSNDSTTSSSQYIKEVEFIFVPLCPPICRE